MAICECGEYFEGDGDYCSDCEEMLNEENLDISDLLDEVLEM